MKKIASLPVWVLISLTLIGGSIFAAEWQPKVIQAIKISTNGKLKEQTVGLVSMDEIMDKPGDNCNQMAGLLKIEELQFHNSEKILERFGFKDKKGNALSARTNIERLPKSQTDLANNFLKAGKVYYAHVQFCGSGGHGSLINIYDSKSNLGAFE
jgi:hypothetical protein